MTTVARVSAVVAVVLTVRVCMFMTTDFRHKSLVRGFNHRPMRRLQTAYAISSRNPYVLTRLLCPLNRPICRVFHGLPARVCPLRTSLYRPGCSTLSAGWIPVIRAYPWYGNNILRIPSGLRLCIRGVGALREGRRGLA
jgi:hypothetical protein